MLYNNIFTDGALHAWRKNTWSVTDDWVQASQGGHQFAVHRTN